MKSPLLFSLLVLPLLVACRSGSKNSSSGTEAACTFPVTVTGQPAENICEYLQGLNPSICVGLGGVSSVGCATTGLTGCCTIPPNEDAGLPESEVQCFYYSDAGSIDAAGENCSSPGVWTSTVPSGA